MKKVMVLAAMLCGISFASNAADAKKENVANVNKDLKQAECVKPAVYELFIMEFSCPKQGWTIPVVGATQLEAAQAYMFYQTHLDC